MSAARRTEPVAHGEVANDAPDEGYADSFDAGPSNDREPVHDLEGVAGLRRNPGLTEGDIAPFEWALSEALATGDGRYTEDDRDLVVAALSTEELPPTVGVRELLPLAREWLDGAVSLRGASRAAPLLLLERLRAEGGRVAQKMAARTLERVARRTPGG